MPRVAALALAAAALAGCAGSTADPPRATAAAPALAQQRCEERFGETARIETVSALRPGYHEIIMGAFDSPRRAACTVSDGGEIVDWVDL